jgi:integrase
MFVISFPGFFRSSEVINLKSNDMNFHHNYISISIRQSKTDQLRDGETVVLTELEDSRICPVKLLKRYLDITRIPPGTNEFLFRPISGQGKSRRLVTVNKPISYATYRESFKRFFKDIVPDISRYSTHSMRAGGATLAANAGVPERQLQRHGRWKSTAAKDMYIKDSLRSRLSVSNSLDSAP